MVSMLTQLRNDGQSIALLDGSSWLISPEDVLAVSKWRLTAEINIKKDKKDSTFPYTMMNNSIGVSVRAKRAD